MNLYTHKDSNIRKTWLLMTMFLLFVIAVGWLFGFALNKPVILYGAIILSLVMIFTPYWYSDKVALAMSGAVPVTHESHENFYHVVENLCITAGLPVPKLYIIPGGQINAFATGRNAEHAAIAVTEGALQKLDKNELEGVLAHELSHIGNRDILLQSVIVVLAGLISIMADWFLRSMFWGGDDRDNKNGAIMLVGIIASILAPIAAMIIQLAISRKREFLADASGALLTRYPEGLASALEKISQDQHPMRRASSANAHLYISNPFRGKAKTSWFSKMFMTHPPIEERVAALRGLKI